MGSRQAPARFSLLETIASAEEREMLCLRRQDGQSVSACETSCERNTDSESYSFFKLAAQRGKEFLTRRMLRFGLSIKGMGRARQMRVVEQLAVGRSTTLVLVEVAGERLLLSLQQGAAATVTALSASSTMQAEALKPGPQRVESWR
jgi:hypothetical protein